LLKAVTLHTNYGDIKVEVFCDDAPVAAEVISLIY
jgi:cyclophilin family peptidyl-prolyl cis-trans isomerase